MSIQAEAGAAPAGNSPHSPLTLPPLSLYVHLPWCVQKCPYCDFNSHAVKAAIPAERYIKALLADLENDLPLAWGRPVHSVFFGGGTPSLFSAAAIDEILTGVRSRLPMAPGAEVTLEANPGTIEHDSFSAYRDAGINRVSLGVQSFDDGVLKAIGRIHGRDEVENAIASLRAARLENFNLDLMFGLPGQSLPMALADVQQALAHKPAHLSHYQLTLEPNTAFHAKPPPLPDDDLCWEMQQQCGELLQMSGFEQYEISAWSMPGKSCAHNMNYWRYGDFLGIGAGAHAKLTLPSSNEIRRISKLRHPTAYMAAAASGNWRAEDRAIDGEERKFEFFLNQLRLKKGVNLADFSPRTGLPESVLDDALAEAAQRGLLERTGERLVTTELGWRFVNEIQGLFLPAEAAAKA
ncbi:MAG TPA: radical SAM family heme chaperone HemW [Xanthomonadales bacterium]|nr:radical SAM family heme chaperone HemW [Xanthomonadales bacterium]